MSDLTKRSPYQLFSGTDVNINPKHWMPFGCPTYVLDSNFHQGKGTGKWKE